MQTQQRPWLHLAKRGLKAVLYGLAFVAPPLVAGYGLMMQANAQLIAPAAQPFVAPVLDAPAHDPTRPTVAIVASNEGTEISDFLAPYAVFAASDAFNVYAVAPERKTVPFMWGGLDIIPHYSFAELDQLLGGDPDVIVIPFVKNAEDPALVQWIRAHAGPKTQLVSICGGALVLAATGLADEGRVTTHQGVFPVLTKKYPHIEAVQGVRYTDNGNTITSAGITAGIDASLYTIQKLLGKERALATARRINYPHVQFLEQPAHQPVSLAQAGIVNVNAAFLWPKREIGVYLHDGVDEIDLTAMLDTYGRTYVARSITFAAERKVVRSRYGLYLAPRHDFASLPDVDRIMAAGARTDVAGVDQLDQWAQRQQGMAVDYLYAAGGSRPFAFDATLADLAQWSSAPDAYSSSITLEYPVEAGRLAGRAWPVHRLWLAVLMACLGVGAAFWLDRRRGLSQQRRVELAPV